MSYELKHKLIELRAKGYSYRKIASILHIGMNTAWDWAQEFKDKIEQLRKLELDDLYERSYIAHEARIKCLSKITSKMLDEIENRDLKGIYTDKLLEINLKYLESLANEKIETKNNIIETKANTSSNTLTFEKFCENADYPTPYPKQVEMYCFAFDTLGAHMLLGARSYGKTDYVTMLGVAYQLYLNKWKRFFILTKSKERNAAILKEIADACKKNGMQFEKENSTCLRVSGLIGKDHSVSTATLKTVTLRGRHPDMILMDDPVTPDDDSEVTRKHAEKVYDEANKLCKNVLIIGQPVHKYDLFAKVRAIIPTLEVPWGSIPELDAIFSDLEAMKLAGVSIESISASYHLKVLSASASPFDQVKFIDKYPAGTSVAFIDPSFEGGDYTALTIMRQHFDGVAVVGFAYKKAWNHCIEEMIKRLKQFNVAKLCFETNSLGDMPLNILRSAVGNIGVVGRKSVCNKHAKIMNAGTFAHLIHLSRESDKIYLDQVTQYEYKSKFDDCPDSLASCLLWLGLIKGDK